ncbi:MAG: PQQ-like beta-propeller repeat protein [Phycisphaerae bacterium]|nr:PQQ-like beta-propeller repeat protein [Phycisphaerae bacterium]
MGALVNRTCCVVMIVCLEAAAACGADWPMLARDLQRTGGTPEEVSPPVRRAWVRYFHEEGLMPTVQPVVVGGRLYIGTLTGRLYAVDAATGRDLWIGETGSPILHTACVTPEGLVAVGCADGTVQAFAANPPDGRPARQWRFATGAAVWNSPLPWQGAVMIGSRDGTLYAIDAATGRPRWTYDAGAPVCQSPAIDPQRNALYVMPEDMRVHCIDAETGLARWISERLPGVTARGFHPVVAPDGSILVATIPFFNWWRAHQPWDRAEMTLFGADELSQPDTRYPGTYSKVTNWRFSKEANDRFDRHTREIFLRSDYFDHAQDEVLKELAADPLSCARFVLSPHDGSQKYTVPALYSAQAQSQFMPAVVTPDGKVVVKIWALLPSRYHGYQRETNVAYLDTANGRLQPFFDESVVNCGNGLNMIGDESCALTASGKYLLNLANHHGELLCYADRTRPGNGAGLYYSTHSHSYGVGIIHRLVRGQIEQIDPGQEDLPRGFGRGVPGEHCTGNHNAANMPAIVADGRIFYAGGGKLMALEPTDQAPRLENKRSLAAWGIDPFTAAEARAVADSFPIEWDYVAERDQEDAVQYYPADLPFPPGTRQRPMEINAPALTVEECDTIIFAPHSAAATPDLAAAADLFRRLTAAVEEFVSQPRWMPYRQMGGKHPVDHMEFFTDPADDLEALAWAYAYLPLDVQQKVVAWVQAGWRQRNPVVDLARHESGQGAPRERFLLGKHEERVFSMSRRAGVERAYAAWLWADRTGRWDDIREIWPRLREGQSYGESTKDTVDWGNARLAGHIALCRIARRLGDDQALARLLPATRQLLQKRLDQARRYPRGNVSSNQLSLWRGMPRWTWLTTEIGQLIRRHAPESAEPLVEKYLDDHRPYWFLAWGPLSPASHENCMQLPQLTMQGFAAQAFVAARHGRRLRPFIDIPHSPADPYYIQKLAITIKSYALP